MTTRYLLDSDAVVDVLYSIPATLALVQTLHDQGAILCTCDVVLVEVYTGVHDRERAIADAFLDSLMFLATSRDAAKRAGEWRAIWRRQGQTLATTDCLIAAVAANHTATIVTGNIKHFPQPDVSLLPLPRSNQRKRPTR